MAEKKEPGWFKKSCLFVVEHWLGLAGAALGTTLFGWMVVAREVVWAHLKRSTDVNNALLWLPWILTAVFLVVGIVLLRRWRGAERRYRKAIKPTTPHFAYVEDVFEDVKFRWKWAKPHRVLRVRSYCLDCDYPIEIEPMGSAYSVLCDYANCPAYNRELCIFRDVDNVGFHVKAMIERRARKIDAGEDPKYPA